MYLHNNNNSVLTSCDPETSKGSGCSFTGEMLTPAPSAQMAAHQPLSASELFLCTLLHLCGARGEGREMLQLSFRLGHPEIRAHIPGSCSKWHERNHMMAEKAPAGAYPCPLPSAPSTAWSLPVIHTYMRKKRVNGRAVGAVENEVLESPKITGKAEKGER